MSTDMQKGPTEVPPFTEAAKAEIARVDLVIEETLKRLTAFERKYPVTSAEFMGRMSADDLEGYELLRRLRQKLEYVKGTPFGDARLDERSQKFLEELYTEKLKHKEHRMNFVLQKLLFTVGLFGLGTVSIPNVNLDLLLYLIPFVALSYDVYIFAEDFKVKRIGEFVRTECSTISVDEIRWERWVSERREPLAAWASLVLTAIAIVASAGAVYVKIPDHTLLVFWLPAGILATMGVFFYGQRLGMNLQKASPAIRKR